MVGGRALYDLPCGEPVPDGNARIGDRRAGQIKAVYRHAHRKAGLQAEAEMY